MGGCAVGRTPSLTQPLAGIESGENILTTAPAVPVPECSTRAVLLIVVIVVGEELSVTGTAVDRVQGLLACDGKGTRRALAHLQALVVVGEYVPGWMSGIGGVGLASAVVKVLTLHLFVVEVIAGEVATA